MPKGTRTSLHENPKYEKVPFAEMTFPSINSTDPKELAVDPVSFNGVQFVANREFQGILTVAGQQFSATPAGASSAEDVLTCAQTQTDRAIRNAGNYLF